MSPKKNRIIWVGREKAIAERFSLEYISSVSECLTLLREGVAAAIFLELSLNKGNGLEVLKEIKRLHEAVEVIAVTAKKSVEEAVAVMQWGAFDYIHQVDEASRIPSIIEKSLENQERNLEIHELRAEFSNQFEEGKICLGKSAEIKKVIQIIDRIAPLQTTVLLHGESGTGKEVMARLIHKKSHLCAKPFVTVSLPSIPSNLVESVLFGHEKGAFTSAHRRHYGKFELADGGTIFLDEIGDLHFDVQSKLLRVIQEGEIERVGGAHPISINVRLIAASKVDLKQAVKNGKFRDDLFYRLNVVPILLPPLRKRIQDIPEFCDLFVAAYARKFNKKVECISPEAVHVLQGFPWPGNIRELENLIERIIAMMEVDQKVIGKEDVPLEYYFANLTERSPSNLNLDQAMVQYERNLIIKALRLNNWNRKKAAQVLGVSYGILKYKVRKLAIEIPGSSPLPSDSKEI